MFLSPTLHGKSSLRRARQGKMFLSPALQVKSSLSSGGPFVAFSAHGQQSGSQIVSWGQLYQAKSILGARSVESGFKVKRYTRIGKGVGGSENTREIRVCVNAMGKVLFMPTVTRRSVQG